MNLLNHFTIVTTLLIFRLLFSTITKVIIIFYHTKKLVPGLTINTQLCLPESIFKRADPKGLSQWYYGTVFYKCLTVENLSESGERIFFGLSIEVHKNNGTCSVDNSSIHAWETYCPHYHLYHDHLQKQKRIIEVRFFWLLQKFLVTKSVPKSNVLIISSKPYFFKLSFEYFAFSIRFYLHQEL